MLAGIFSGIFYHVLVFPFYIVLVMLLAMLLYLLTTDDNTPPLSSKKSTYHTLSWCFWVCAWIGSLVSLIRIDNAQKHFVKFAGFSPPSSVNRIYYQKYSGWGGGDTEFWLKIDAVDHNMFNRILHTQQFKQLIPSPTCDYGEFASDEPFWWDISARLDSPETVHRIEAYQNSDRIRLYVDVCYDTKHQIVYYHFLTYH